MGPRPKPKTPWAPLKLGPVKLGPDTLNAQPNANPSCFTWAPELVSNAVVSLEKNPVVSDPSA